MLHAIVRHRPVFRRVLFAVVALGAVATTLLLSESRPAAAASASSASAPDSWVRALKGSHRQLFDAPAPEGGIPLVHVMNYYDSYNKAFGVKDTDISGILTFYGRTVFHGLTDEMWAKYRIGEFLKENDASGVPYAANPWRSAPTILGMTIPAASVEALQKRGATFILCNNALTIFSGLLAKSRGLDATAVYEDMRAHVLQGVTVVPAMVIAIEQAQRAGVSYHRQ